MCAETCPWSQEAPKGSGARTGGWLEAGWTPALAEHPYLTTCSRICKPKCRTMAVCVFSASFSPQGTQMGHFSLNSSQNCSGTGTDMQRALSGVTHLTMELSSPWWGPP